MHSVGKSKEFGVLTFGTIFLWIFIFYLFYLFIVQFQQQTSRQLQEMINKI